MPSSLSYLRCHMSQWLRLGTSRSVGFSQVDVLSKGTQVTECWMWTWLVSLAPGHEKKNRTPLFETKSDLWNTVWHDTKDYYNQKYLYKYEQNFQLWSPQRVLMWNGDDQAHNQVVIKCRQLGYKTWWVYSILTNWVINELYIWWHHLECIVLKLGWICKASKGCKSDVILPFKEMCLIT